MRPMRVLVIEDNPDDSDLQARELRRAGFDVVTASGGHEGVRMALQEWPDVILCDLKMAHGNGYEVADACKANQYLRSKPLIALTGEHSMFADHTRALEVGFDALLFKPLKISEFNAEVARLCPPSYVPPTSSDQPK